MTVATVILLLCMSSKTILAAGTSGWLKNNYTYKKYDLDGDGKKDSVILKESNSGSGIKGTLAINGKNVYSLPNPSQASLGAKWQVITLGNGRNFILGYTVGSNPGICRPVLLQYLKSKKIKVVRDFTSLFGDYRGVQSFQGVAVSGNSVGFDFDTMSWTCGTIRTTIKYQYHEGTLKLASHVGKVGNKTLTADKKFKTYKKYLSDKVAFTVKKGDEVTVVKYYLKGNAFWVRLKNSAGKMGWIKGIKKPNASRSPLFSNGWYVG